MKQVIIYISPNFDFDGNDIEFKDIEKMTQEEKLTWAKNVPTEDVTIYYSLESFCLDFNLENISDLGWCYVGQTLI